MGRWERRRYHGVIALAPRSAAELRLLAKVAGCARRLPPRRPTLHKSSKTSEAFHTPPIPHPTDPLTANEAASVTGAPLKQVHRIIDAGLLLGWVERLVKARMISGFPKAMVDSHPQIMAGAPCFVGTRIPVHDIADMMADGDTVEALAAAYPQPIRAAGRPPAKPTRRKAAAISL
jgi:uncharacterized protein (DUF433 family)